jgi:hypothetical protein
MKSRRVQLGILIFIIKEVVGLGLFIFLPFIHEKERNQIRNESLKKSEFLMEK